MPIFAFGTALGALLSYFFDPQNGKRRRHMLADRTGAFFRSSGRQAERAGRAVAAEAYGAKQKATHLKEEPTEIFRGADAPKGDVVVNVQDGVVQLRGEVERPELIETLVEQTRKVQGVK